MPKQSPKSVKSGTRKTPTPNKANAKPATTPKAVAKKTSPRTPKESPKAKEAKETLAKIANTKQGKATTPKGKAVSPKTSPKSSPASKVVPLDAEASTNLFDTPRASRQASPKAQSPSGKVLSKVAPKGKSASPASKVTNDSPKSAKGKASKGAIANKLSPLPKVASKPTTPKGKVASPKGKAAKGKGSPKAKKPVVEESSSDDEPVEFKTGDLIDAEWEDNLFYSARVIKVNKLKSGTTYDVEFTQDGIQIKKLTREQIQSYSADEDDEPARHRAKVSIDDQDYVDGFVPIPEEDASVESDSTDEPRKRGRSRKQGGGVQKRKRAASETVAEKKRKVHTGLDNMTQKQLVTLVNQVCAQNPKILDTVLERIPEKKLQLAKRGRK